MMRTTNKLMIGKAQIILFYLFLQNTPAISKTVYSLPFDYHKFQSSDAYFSGRSKAQITRFCKTQLHASTADIEQCEHREFEQADRTLNRTISRLTPKIRENDAELKEDANPLALPFFTKAQDEWVLYRDDYCYSKTYATGPASARYIYFWACMKNITMQRTKQLNSFFEE